MKWYSPRVANPAIGDRRIVKKFAFLPTRIGNHRVWLESYWQEEIFHYGWEGGVDEFWSDVNFGATDPSCRRWSTKPNQLEENV